MNKQLSLFATMLTFCASGMAQCDIDPFVQDNYLTDAWTMVFREFADDPAHPDYDTPILDEQKTVPYLEKISAIYDLADTNPVADSLFTEFAIHASSSVPLDIVFGEIYLEVDENEPWLLDFIDTGISGVPALDLLMSTYEFTVTNAVFVDPGSLLIIINSDLPFLNHFALLDDFLAIDGIIDTYANDQGDGSNYNGIPFQINGENVVASNIVTIDDGLRFTLHVDFCGNSCNISRGWDVLISEDCSQVTIEELKILAAPEFSQTRVAIYPNPVEDVLHFDTKNMKIEAIQVYNELGVIALRATSPVHSLDFSGLGSGLYFVEIQTEDNIKTTYKLVKN